MLEIPLVGLSGCKTAEQALLEKGVMPMHKAQMREEFVGKTLYGETESGRRWVEYMDSNGTARLKWVDNGSIQRGTWNMEEFNSCFSYDGRNAGIPNCYKTYKDDDEFVYFKDGKNKTGKREFKIYRIEADNVEAL